MRTLLCAIPALLALAGPALAEPQQLDEAQLGGIAAGQEALASTCRPANSTPPAPPLARPTRFEER